MYRVLLVEDEEIIRKGIRYSVPWEECGCSVVGEAENGAVGEEKIAELQPDIVITDITMPVKNGLEMIADTREKFNYIAIILTGYSEFEYAQQAIRNGVSDYVLKPLDMDEMRTALEKAVRLAGDNQYLQQREDEAEAVQAFLPEPNQPRLSDAGVMKISKKATTIAIVNQKGGTGKTTTCENLGIGLAMEGKKVLLVDADPQGSLTISMGWQQPDELPTTLSTLMQKAINDQSIPPGEGVLHHAEGVDLIPANIELAGLEVSLVNCMNREKMLKQVLEGAKHEYDFILLDCTPSLGMLTVNALAAADTTLIPVQAQYLSAKGLEQLLQTVQKVRRQINPKLKIEGILLTMTDSRTNYGQQIDNLIRGAYGSKIKVFDQTIPRSVRAAEISAVGKSIFQHDPKGKVAEAYQSLTKEVLANAEKQLKRVAERGR